MKTDAELFDMAVKAGYDYKKVFGVYPGRIGVEAERLKLFSREYICFVSDMPSFSMSQWDTSPSEWPETPYHQVYFAPIIGATASEDEVYLPVPGKKGRAFTGMQVAQVVKLKEAEERVFVGLQCREVKA